jgi:hypothetical protein
MSRTETLSLSLSIHVLHLGLSLYTRRIKKNDKERKYKPDIEKSRKLGRLCNEQRVCLIRRLIGIM